MTNPTRRAGGATRAPSVLIRPLLALLALLPGAYLARTAAAGFAATRAIDKAAIVRRHGDFSAAFAVLDGAARLAPGSAELWAARGEAYRGAFTMRDAFAASASPTPPGAPRPWYARPKGEYLELAVRAYRRAAELNPLDWLPAAQLGLTLSRGGRHAEADAAYRAALERDPHNPGLIVMRAQALEAAGRPADALAEYRRSAAILPNADALEAIARLGGGHP